MKARLQKAPGGGDVAALLPQIEEQAQRETETEQTVHSSLLLGGRAIHEGDQLILHIFDGWIAGVVQQDQSSWYLLTAAQVRVRLSAGLTARWAATEGKDTEEAQDV